MDEQPVEATLYSLDRTLPTVPERRTDERHLSLLRVGSLTIAGHRELCLIKNVSAGGMLIRAYCSIPAGTAITIELKHGEPVNGTARWTRDGYVGVTFDHPVDVLGLLTASADGPRPRMPRIEVDYTAWIRVNADVYRGRVRNISQGGLKLECRAELPVGVEAVVSIEGLAPSAGMLRWSADGDYGFTFNRVVPLPVLVAWLQDRRGQYRAAG